MKLLKKLANALEARDSGMIAAYSKEICQVLRIKQVNPTIAMEPKGRCDDEFLALSKRFYRMLNDLKNRLFACS